MTPWGSGRPKGGSYKGKGDGMDLANRSFSSLQNAGFMKKAPCWVKLMPRGGGLSDC